jgi:GR25 family glycosyltransferase involved in LPS biosynthesis
MNTPILFLIFNRPETTAQSFDVIRSVKPSRLYVAADGPRLEKTGERELCIKTRSLIKIDWECELKMLFSDQNLGCGRAVSKAITWFFENEEEGIILEDDIIPHLDFFPYCEELLAKYRDDERIQLITGRNFFYEPINSNESYYFSGLFHIWGWASWKRVWKDYHFDLSYFSEIDFDKKISFYQFPKSVNCYWKNIFVMMKYNPIDTWDYQLLFNQWYYQRYCIIPLINLTENIGFGINATHTITDEKSEKFKGAAILPLCHPDKVKENRPLDKIYARSADWSLNFIQLMKRKSKKFISRGKRLLFWYN